MSVQIIIDGKHSTDVLAELKILSDALGSKPEQLELPLDLPKVNSVDPALEDSNETVEKEVIYNPEPITGLFKKLSRGDHKREADKMIAAGEKDEAILSLLSRGQQKRVEEALKTTIKEYSIANKCNFNIPKENNIEEEVVITNKVETVNVDVPKSKADEALGLFDDEPEVENQQVTLESLSDMIKTKCRDENGKDIPEMYAAVRSELKNCVGKDKEPRLSNVPESKYTDLFNSINSIVLPKKR